MTPHPLVRLAVLRRVVQFLETGCMVLGTAIFVGGMLVLTALAFAGQP